MEFVDTPITRLFGIYLRSYVKKKGAKASVNVEPSLCLSLDIEVGLSVGIAFETTGFNILFSPDMFDH